MRTGHGEQVFEVWPGEPMGGCAGRAHGVGGVLDPRAGGAPSVRVLERLRAGVGECG